MYRITVKIFIIVFLVLILTSCSKNNERIDLSSHSITVLPATTIVTASSKETSIETSKISTTAKVSISESVTLPMRADFAKTLTASDFKMESLILKEPCFSPSGKKILLFASDEFNFYYLIYDIENEVYHKVFMYEKDYNTHMLLSKWSDDESIFIFSIYVYDVATQKSKTDTYVYEILIDNITSLDTGSIAAISPDKKKIAFSNREGYLCVYEIVNDTTTILSEDIKGGWPIWFSDSKRVVIIKGTGNKPESLYGVEIHEMYIIDIENMENNISLGHSTVYKNIEWLKQDELILVETGWDDGYYRCVLDLKDNSFSEDISGYNYNYTYTDGFYIYNSNIENGEFLKRDRDMNIVNEFSYDGNIRSVSFICEIDENSILVNRVNWGEQGQLMILSNKEENGLIITSMETPIMSIVSRDGKYIVYEEREMSTILIIKVEDLISGVFEK